MRAWGYETNPSPVASRAQLHEDALHTQRPFLQLTEQGADSPLTVKSNQKTVYRQIASQLLGIRHIPFTATEHESGHGRDIT